MTDLTELAALDAKATPGPWFAEGRLPGKTEHAVFAQDGIACVALCQPGCLPASGREDAVAANARLIVTLRNAVPESLAALAERDTLRAEVERLRGAIQRCLEELYAPPADCSCHLSPPCSDCVEYAGIREAEEVARAALNGGKP